MKPKARNKTRIKPAVETCLNGLAGMFLLAIISFCGTFSANAQVTYNTKFTSGGALALNYVNGGFSATLIGVSLSYDSIDNIRNIGPGNLSLSFSQPVASISFDVGGLDAVWGDQITFPLAPTTIGPAQNNDAPYTLSPLVLNGTTITPGGNGNGGGGRVTFSGLPGIYAFSFPWTDTGTAGPNDWTFYDNFSFTTIPEPTVVTLAGLGALSVLLFRRQRK